MVPSYGAVAGVGNVSESSVAVLGGTVVPGGTKVTECGSGPAMSHVTVVPVATFTFSGRNSSTAMFGSLGSLTPATSDTAVGAATARGVAAWTGTASATSPSNARVTTNDRAQTKRAELHESYLLEKRGSRKLSHLLRRPCHPASVPAARHAVTRACRRRGPRHSPSPSASPWVSRTAARNVSIEAASARPTLAEHRGDRFGEVADARMRSITSPMRSSVSV